MSYISVIGGIIMDIKAHPHASPILKTSNPGRIVFSAGGVARNIAENLARLDVPVKLFGKVGNDPIGELLIKSCEKVNIDASAIEKDNQQTSSIDLNMMDQTGDLLISMTDLDISETIGIEYIHAHAESIFSGDFVLTDLNIPKGTLQYIVNTANKRGVPLIIEPVSVWQIEKLRNIKGDIFLLKPNEQEWQTLSNGDYSPNIQHLIISMGEKGVLYKHSQQEVHHAALETEVVDTLGAGDALLSGILMGLNEGFEWTDCIRWGIAAATLTLLSTESYSPRLSRANCQALL